MRLICCEALISEFSELLSNYFSIKLSGLSKTFAKFLPILSWSTLDERYCWNQVLSIWTSKVCALSPKKGYWSLSLSTHTAGKIYCPDRFARAGPPARGRYIGSAKKWGPLWTIVTWWLEPSPQNWHFRRPPCAGAPLLSRQCSRPKFSECLALVLRTWPYIGFPYKLPKCFQHASAHRPDARPPPTVPHSAPINFFLAMLWQIYMFWGRTCLVAKII